ncbi:hypothetical protein D3C87_1441360 [compost metagenome]
MDDGFNRTIDDAVFEQGGVVEEIHQMIGREAMDDRTARRFNGGVRQVGQHRWWEPVAGFQLMLQVVR